MASPPDLLNFDLFEEIGKNEKPFDVFGLFSQLGACSVSVATFGVFRYAVFSICRLKRCPERSEEAKKLTNVPPSNLGGFGSQHVDGLMLQTRTVQMLRSGRGTMK